MKKAIWILGLLALVTAINLPEKGGKGTGPGGWETGGGDLSALEYVKIGRALGDEMSKNRLACSQLTRIVDPAQFLHAVDSLRVTSVNETPSNTPGGIQFNRREWYNSSKSEHLAEVFRGYSVSVLSRTTRIVESEISRCLPKSAWRKVFSRVDEGATGGMPVFLREFRQANSSLKSILIAHSKEVSAWSIPTSRVLEIIEKAERGEKDFSLSASPVSIHFNSGEIKDGRNGKKGENFFMSLNEPLWIRSSEAQRVELLFHEYLGLAGIDDSLYQNSSRLYKIVPARLFAML